MRLFQQTTCMRGAAMSRRSVQAMAALLCVTAVWPSFAQERPASQPVAAVVDTLAGVLVARGECVGVAVGVDHGGVQGFFAYGEAVRGSGRRPEPRTEFQISSITKVFTTTLLALYANRHVVRLDAPLQNYVPRGITVPSFAGRQITLMELATHTSGLPRQPPRRGDSLSPADMFAFLNSYRLPRAPGAQFEYSNFGVALLAHALAKATDTPWETLVERDITSKLGMPDTRLNLDNEQRARMAVGYDQAGMRAREKLSNWPAFNGAGALFSTVNDLMKFLAWNEGEAKSDLNSLLDDLHKPRFALRRPGAAMGLAWHILPMGTSGSSIAWKNGGTLGYSSYIGFVPGAKSGIVVLSNTVSCPAAGVGAQILATLNGQVPEGIKSLEEGN
jgi:serine-type D-Ala-D-Ala carboxypeptidase/endopeptidase